MTGMDMPWSWAAGAALGAGDFSTKSCFGGLTLQNADKMENIPSASYCGFDPIIVIRTKKKYGERK